MSRVDRRMTAQNTCPCCGSRMKRAPLSWNLEQRVVSRGGQAIRLTKTLAQAFDVILASGREGRTVQQVFDHIYDCDPDGGPLTGYRTMHVHICTLRNRLAQIGILISDANRCGGRYYVEEEDDTSGRDGHRDDRGHRPGPGGGSGGGDGILQLPG